jgi:hypothetical protein
LAQFGIIICGFFSPLNRARLQPERLRGKP